MAGKCSNYARNWGLCFSFWIMLFEADYAKKYASILYQCLAVHHFIMLTITNPLRTFPLSWLVSPTWEILNFNNWICKTKTVTIKPNITLAGEHGSQRVAFRLLTKPAARSETTSRSRSCVWQTKTPECLSCHDHYTVGATLCGSKLVRLSRASFSGQDKVHVVNALRMLAFLDSLATLCSVSGSTCWRLVPVVVEWRKKTRRSIEGLVTAPEPEETNGCLSNSL